MSKRVVWVVEMKNGPRWEPTVGAALSRDDGHDNKRWWEERNPSDRFRVVPYIPRVTRRKR